MNRCPHCDFENLPTASFCVNCGRVLARPHTAPDTRELTRTHDAAPQAERRFVTILFADLSGFTALSETHDPETVRELVNACFDQLVPRIENHHGVVDQFVGDAIVALFGAPHAHEDDPAQACRAALEMMDALDTVNAERGTSLGLHIGINSGMVLAGGIGSRERQQYSVLGDAVNMASRLQDAAERGEIFVGAETYKLARDHFEFVSRGTMAFKGKSEPQPVWQLVRAKPNAPVHRALRTASPLLGRERELGLLERVTRELLSEDASLRVVSILGDAGVGKSRLVQEWRAAQPDVNFVLAACAPDGATRAYALASAIARAVWDAQNDAAPNSLAFNALLGTSADAQNFLNADDATLQAEFVNALRELLWQQSQTRALVVVCEDLHWADAPSLQVIQRVAAQLLDARILLTLTTRTESGTPGWTLIQELQELPGVAALRLHLAPLAEQDARALLNALEPDALPPEISQLILARAEGNPLFVEELVNMLRERGAWKREQEQWTLTRERVILDVPNTLQGVLMARIDELPSDARNVLQIASLLGREFSVDILEEMLKRTTVVSLQTE